MDILEPVISLQYTSGFGHGALLVLGVLVVILLIRTLWKDKDEL